MSAASKEPGGELGGGLAVTGNYPGKARTADELRARPGQGALAHPRQAPAESARLLRRAGRDRRSSARDYTIEHFQGWVDWCKARGLGLRFQSDLLRASAGGRRLHAFASRRERARNSGSSTASPAAASPRKRARQLGTTVVTNFWIPDGYKDQPADRKAPRERLAASLDDIFAEPIDASAQSRCGRVQALRHRQRELRRRLARVLPRLRDHAAKALCLDAGHFHPTESLADKISSVLQYRPRRCCCMSAAACAGTAITSCCSTIRRARSWRNSCAAISSTAPHIGLDFFDASINRIAAWVIGTRNALKALLLALLEPTATLRAAGSHRRFHRPPRAAGGAERRCPSAPSGTNTAGGRMCRQGMALAGGSAALRTRSPRRSLSASFAQRHRLVAARSGRTAHHENAPPVLCAPRAVGRATPRCGKTEHRRHPRR